jgi:hypothetical protein
MGYGDSDNDDQVKRSRGSDKIDFAFERGGTIDPGRDFGWLIQYLNDELEGHPNPGVELLSFWVKGQPNPDWVSGTLLARKEAVGNVVQTFTDMENVPLTLSVTLPGIPNQDRVVLCIAWPGGQPSPSALSFRDTPDPSMGPGLPTDIGRTP